jgi:succinate dehydrogenase/fumarate reductase iron-sulfur protein
MTCYIPKIDDPEDIYNIRIRRYNPEKDKEPYWASYKIPFVNTMTVVEALEYLWDQGEYIAFRTNCREFTCGSCAMLINGKPRLACDTLLKNNMTLEPLARYPFIKDLVVDTSAIHEKIKELRYWPIRKGEEKEFKITKEALEDFIEIYSRCIECYCCLEACPASRSENAQFDGPMHVLQLARAGTHPLDINDRTQQASERGVWSCVSCFECANVCPVNLSPGEVIANLRRKAIKNKVFQLLGIGTK